MAATESRMDESLEKGGMRLEYCTAQAGSPRSQKTTKRRILDAMRGSSALALLTCCLAISASAQRGGGARGGGFGGGHATGGFRGGFAASAPRGGIAGSAYRGRAAAPARTAFGNGPRVPFAGGVRSPYPGQGFRGAPGAFASRVPVARPTFYSRDGRGYPGAGRLGGYRGGYGPRFRSPYFSYGFSGLFFSPFFGLDFLDWDSLDGFGFDGPGYGDQGYAPPPAYPDPAGYTNQAGYSNQAEGYAAPASEQEGRSAPGPWAPGYEPAARLPEEDAVTVIFKDGRPPVQVRNYALTRTALYLSGDHARVIPLDEIDVPSTERVNRAAGVSFTLP